MVFAPITAARVYRNCAVVRRKAAVALQAGDNDVILSGISDTADPDSLRLFFSSGVVGKDMRIIPFSEGVDRLPSADVTEEIAELQNKIHTLKTVEDLWISNGNFTNREGWSAENVEGFLGALPAHLENLREQKRALCRQIEALEIKKNALEQKEAFRVVKLVIAAQEACEAVFEMEYFDNAAHWTATYEIHTTSDSDSISAISRARIVQNTGEDWENIRLTLYTGSPAARMEIPELKKLNLRFRPEMPGAKMMRSASMEAFGAAAPMPMMSMMADMASPNRMVMEESEEVDADTMTGYVLPGIRTVISGSDGTMADLKTDTITADKRIVCVPKLDDSAYLAAMIKTADWPLKPAKAKIYLNENYCGEIFVSPDPDKEVFMLSLGRDERIGVNRTELRTKTEDVLLKGQKRQISEYAIRIRNNQEKPLTVLVWDQIPVSVEKQIVVDHVSVDGASLDETTGKLNWNLTVPGKEVIEKRLSYTVTHPKDKSIQETRTEAAGGLKICMNCGAYAEGKFCPVCSSRME